LFSSLYSLAIERVACVLASKIELPVCEDYLEEVNGELGVVSLKVPGNPWGALDDDTIDNVVFVDRERWTLYMSFDVLMANVDRHPDNIFVEWDPPSRREVVRGEQCALWLIDFGWSGLWPVYKFGSGLGPSNLHEIDPAADLTDAFCNSLRNAMPVPYRRRFALRGSDERKEALEIIRQISEDDIDAAVQEVPEAYMTTQAANLTSEFLKQRLARIDSLVDQVFPT
jgi:hypothetical protein